METSPAAGRAPPVGFTSPALLLRAGDRAPTAGPRLLLRCSEHFISNPSVRSSHKSRPLWEGSGLQPLAGGLAGTLEAAPPILQPSPAAAYPTEGEHREEEEEKARGRDLTRPGSQRMSSPAIPHPHRPPLLLTPSRLPEPEIRLRRANGPGYQAAGGCEQPRLPPPGRPGAARAVRGWGSGGGGSSRAGGAAGSPADKSAHAGR